ncbi:hypothetical protein [Parasphingorhabdus sp. NYA22]
MKLNYRTFNSLALLLMIFGCSESDQSTDEDNLASSPIEEQMWVTSERLDRRTCPSDNCGVVGRLFFRESAKVLEKEDGWARITEAYNASCTAGVSKYIDEGRQECSQENGIIDGKFAEWVKLDNLSTERPADPALTANADDSLVAQSDDFLKYRKSFVSLASQLIADGRCTADDFNQMGGWVKSVTQYRNEPVYFTYCGGMNSANKVYINAETEKVVY